MWRIRNDEDGALDNIDELKKLLLKNDMTL